jgi:diguanylate cyclase
MTSPEVDLVVDTLAGILRDFGRHAFDLTRQDARRTQAVFDQWAQHIVVGAEAPGGQKGAVAGLAQRQFAALRSFFTQHRRIEQSEVTASQDALRDVVWSFVASLNRVTSEDQADDAQVNTTLKSLAEAVDKPTVSPNDIRRVALDAVKAIQALMETRAVRQARQIEELSTRLASLGTQLEVARKESTTDGLTMLFNRRAFDDQLSRTSDLTSLKRSGAALLLLDIDHFKTVNDTYGHPAGDAVLKFIASTCVRTFKRKNDFVARYGGEEFSVLLTDLSEPEALTAAEKCREAIASSSVVHDGRALTATISIGVAPWRQGEDVAAWLTRADAALYRAKHDGRNRVMLG